MTSISRRAGVDLVKLVATSDETPDPGRAYLYAKDVGGASQVFAAIDEGSFYQLTPPVAVNATSTPTRTFGVAFQPSADRMTRVQYSARVVAESTVIAPQGGRIELLCDATNPPTTVRGRVAAGVTVSSGTVSVTNEGVLTYLVPPGHYVLLQTVDEADPPTYSITTQVEQTL